MVAYVPLVSSLFFLLSFPPESALFVAYISSVSMYRSVWYERPFVSDFGIVAGSYFRQKIAFSDVIVPIIVTL